MSSHRRKSEDAKPIPISREPSYITTDITEWLHRFKLTDFKQIFLSNNISIDELISLNNDELKHMAKHTFKMTQILHRKRFLDAVLNTKALHFEHNFLQNGHFSNNSNRSISFTDDSKQSSSNSDKHKCTLLNQIKQTNGGYKMHLFIDQNEAQKYQCSLCHQVCFKLVELGCNDNEEDHDGFFYCKQCIKTHLANNESVCPINKQHKNIKIHSNRWMRKRI